MIRDRANLKEGMNTMQTSTERHGNLAQFRDWKEAWEWAKGRLLSDKTELIGLSLMTVVVYGLVLLAHFRAFEARTIAGF